MATPHHIRLDPLVLAKRMKHGIQHYSLVIVVMIVMVVDGGNGGNGGSTCILGLKP